MEGKMSMVVQEARPGLGLQVELGYLLQTHAGYLLSLLVVCLAIAVDGEGDGGWWWSWGKLVVKDLVELCWLGTCACHDGAGNVL